MIQILLDGCFVVAFFPLHSNMKTRVSLVLSIAACSHYATAMNNGLAITPPMGWSR